MDKAKQFKHDVEQTLAKYDVKDCIVILRQPVKDHEIRVMMFTSKPKDQEHDLATLLEAALNVSKGLRNIFEHMSSHAVHHILSDLQFKLGGKKAD